VSATRADGLRDDRRFGMVTDVIVEPAILPTTGARAMIERQRPFRKSFELIEHERA
jgi:hypothetical protein